MKVIRHSDTNFCKKLRELTAPSSLFDPVIEQRTRAILDAVQARGDAALLEFTEKFDGARLAVQENATTGGFLGQSFALTDVELGQDDNPVEAVKRPPRS